MKRRKKGKPVLDILEACMMVRKMTLPKNFRVELWEDGSTHPPDVSGNPMVGPIFRVEHHVTKKDASWKLWIGTTYRLEATGPEEFLGMVRSAMCNLAVHEIDEFFTYNGKFINDPHPKLKGAK